MAAENDHYKPLFPAAVEVPAELPVSAKAEAPASASVLPKEPVNSWDAVEQIMASGQDDVELSQDMQRQIESALVVAKRQRPGIFPGVGGGAVYRSFNFADHIRRHMEDIEKKWPGSYLWYDDMEGWWFPQLHLVYRPKKT